MRLTKKTAERLFKDQVKLMKLKGHDVPTKDRIYMRETWSYFTDMLCKDGYITESQYERWSNPY